MVQVIDPRPQPEALKEIVCKGCGARLAYTQNDVQRRDGTDYGGGPDGAEWIVCPQPQCTGNGLEHRIILRSW